MSNVNIFNISKEYFDILNQIDILDGEVTPEIEELLLKNELGRDEKLDSICKYISNLKGTNYILDDEMARLKDRKDANLRAIDSLKKIIINVMEMYGLKGKNGNLSHKTSLHTIYSKTFKSVNIDETALPQYDPILGNKTSEFITYVTSEKFKKDDVIAIRAIDGHDALAYNLSFDKKALKEELIANAVPSAPLEQGLFDDPDITEVDFENPNEIDFATLDEKLSLTIK